MRVSTDDLRLADGFLGTDMLGNPGGWRELVEQIDLLEELIADVRDSGDQGGEFVLAELQRLLASRRKTLRARLDAGAV